MATSRRFSRGTPHNVLLTRAQQISFLDALAHDAKFRRGVEILMGVENILDLPKQEQIAAVRRYIENGYRKALIAQIAGAEREFDGEVTIKEEGLSPADKIALLEEDIARLREDLAKAGTKPAVKRKAVRNGTS